MAKSKVQQAASEMGKKGGPKGGRARALKLSPEDRAAIAAHAALARWHGEDLLQATHAGVLSLGGVEVPCYVLSDGRHVLAQTAMQVALGMSRSGGNSRAHRLSSIFETFDQKGLKTSDIAVRTDQVIRFSNLGAPGVVHGIEASVMVDLCRLFVEARRMDILSDQAQHIAARCEVLLAGFAQVGLLGLIREVTGYRADRARDALATILERFIAKELRPWVRTFPSDYYKHVFRLRGWDFDETSVKRPGCLGYITTDVVYARLAPGVVDELKRITPRTDKGRLKHKLHQRLTEEMGHPKLREHLTGVTYLLKTAPSWRGFKDQLDLAVPRFGDTLLLDFGPEDRVD